MKKKLSFNKLKIKGGIVKVKGTKLIVKPKIPFRRKLIYAGLALTTLILSATIYVVEYALRHKISGDTTPVEANAPIEFLTDLEKDEKGLYIENPINEQEIENSKIFLTENLLNDLRIFDEEFNSFDKISAVYKHDLFTKNPSLLNEVGIIDVFIKKGDKTYILQYTALSEDFPKGITIEKGVNDADTINNFSKVIQKCYPTDLIEAKEVEVDYKKYLAGNAIYYSETEEYKIPVYNNENVKYFSISTSLMDEYIDDVSNETAYELFENYLNNKNDMFYDTDVSTKEYQKDLVSVLNKNSDKQQENTASNINTSKIPYPYKKPLRAEKKILPTKERKF